MGLILAIFEVALPDDESHFNVISITILENAEKEWPEPEMGRFFRPGRAPFTNADPRARLWLRVSTLDSQVDEGFPTELQS
jgi:hypothetical protein